VDRWANVVWGYKVIGQFKSQKQINNYPVNIDGQGNTTLLPGDLIYKDVNGDGVINQYDVRPIGIGSYDPVLSAGLHMNLSWRRIHLYAGFVYGGMFSHTRNYEARWPFQSTGNLLKEYLDRWHREDPRDPNSKWIPGKYPPLRFNDPDHSNYNKNSSYWTKNVRYLRLHNLQVGYTFPQKWVNKAHLTKATVYLNAQNVFTIDNVPSFEDPTISEANSLQYPQVKYYNIGVKFTF
jgi:hypothetical protein